MISAEPLTLVLEALSQEFRTGVNWEKLTTSDIAKCN